MALPTGTYQHQLKQAQKYLANSPSRQLAQMNRIYGLLGKSPLPKKKYPRTFSWAPQTGSGITTVSSTWLNTSTTTSASTIAIQPGSTVVFTSGTGYAQSTQYAQQQAGQQQAAFGSIGGGAGGAMNNQMGVYQAPQLSHDDLAKALKFSDKHVVLHKMRMMVRNHYHFPMPIHKDTPIGPPSEIRLVDGYHLEARDCVYMLPDGSTISIDNSGNYKVEDTQAKVTYKANRVREFNPYVNASDLMEAFVKDVGKHPLVTQMNVLALPVEAFINWLIHKAAVTDGDNLEGLPTVDDALRKLAAPVAA